MQVFDQSALSLEAKEEMYKLYPNAKRAHLKTGGNFPYLCRSAEVNLYIQVLHLLDLGVLLTPAGSTVAESRDFPGSPSGFFLLFFTLGA